MSINKSTPPKITTYEDGMVQVHTKERGAPELSVFKPSVTKNRTFKERGVKI